MTAPVCECHGLPKLWEPDRREPRGGFWRCQVRRHTSHRRANQAYYASDKGQNRRLREYKQRLRKRIAHKSIRIAELEAQLKEYGIEL